MDLVMIKSQKAQTVLAGARRLPYFRQSEHSIHTFLTEDSDDRVWNDRKRSDYRKEKGQCCNADYNAEYSIDTVAEACGLFPLAITNPRRIIAMPDGKKFVIWPANNPSP